MTARRPQEVWSFAIGVVALSMLVWQWFPAYCVAGENERLPTKTVSCDTILTANGRYVVPEGYRHPGEWGDPQYASTADSLRSLNVDLVGRLPYGPSLTVTADGNLIYLARGGRLDIVDATVPSDPQIRGGTTVLSVIDGIAVSGDYVYLAVWDGGLRVIDASNPENPVEVGFQDTPGLSQGVTVVGTYAYVRLRGGQRVRSEDYRRGVTCDALRSWLLRHGKLGL
jgi:hypothetical protein